jgi:hypothetical protein
VSDYVVDFPTLGDIQDAWLAQHARVPNGFQRGRAFVQADWQFWCTANHYRVREDAQWIPEAPLLNQAFVFRRSQIVGPQKLGKGPWSAGGVALEAVGPTIFRGWAGKGDGYACSDHGCGCGWEYEYLPGEAMGIRHPSPLIQMTAISEEQVNNVWRPLRAMISLGPLSDLLLPRGNFIKIAGQNDDPELDRIDRVTASAQSRVGNPISFALQDESGLATAENKMVDVYEGQRRNAAGIGGRTMETTNAWNPAQNSVAQRTYESSAEDVFKFWRKPPANLSYRDKRERRRIHAFVYEGSPWVTVDSIEAEASELLERDPAQAERFFGNRVVTGTGAWLADTALAAWDAKAEVRDRPLSEPVCLGFDGSDVDDWTAIRLETFDFHQFTPVDSAGRPTIWNPAEHDGRIPREDVMAAFEHVFASYDVVRAYLDPPGWESQVSALQGRYGEKRVIEWPTYRIKPMHESLERFRNDIVDPKSGLTHDDDKTVETHLRNAVMRGRTGKTYILGKASHNQKIDAVMAATLAHEAVNDAIAGDDLAKRKAPAISTTFYGFS